MKTQELKFDWRWKDYGLRATPKRLVRFDDDESNETIDFIKYFLAHLLITVIVLFLGILCYF